MAGSTFLVLTNKLLRRLNEVQLTSTTFASAKNTQAMAQDAIIAAIAEINTTETQWPWNTQTGTASVVLNTLTYSFTTDEVVPDWDTFRLVKTATVPAVTLKYITSEEYYKYYRQIDLAAIDATTLVGQGQPKFIFPVPGGFGISPSPDTTYTINYEFYKTPTEPALYSDTTDIPTVWDYVIINLALKHYYMYKDNTEQAGFWINESNKTLTKMRNSMVNRPDYVWSNMVNFGGQKWSIDYTKL